MGNSAYRKRVKQMVEEVKEADAKDEELLSLPEDDPPQNSIL